MKNKASESKRVLAKPIKSEIKLTIGMLVSNHVQYIRNCMEALKPLLDAVPSELVVLDTKGEDTDGSIAIVREYTDRVYPFTWCNDFSAARNALLEHSRGEWFLYQDDDEWFDNVQEFIDFFQNGDHEKYFSGFYYTHDYDADGSYSVGIAGRMIRRLEDTRFVGKVHEHFEKVYAPNKQFSCFTHHYGYAFQTAEDAKKHQERNVSILKEELASKGEQPEICAQLVQEYMAVPDTARMGYDFAVSCIEKHAKEQFKSSSFQWMLAATVRYFTLTGEYEEMLAQAEKIRQGYVLSQLAELAIAAVTAKEAAERSDVEQVEKYVKIYLDNWDWRERYPEEALLQTQMDFPKFLEDRWYFSIVEWGVVSANYKKDYLLAKKYVDRLTKNTDKEKLVRYYPLIQETLQGLKELAARETAGQGQAEEAECESKPVCSDVKLSIGILVSNSISTIEKCMKSLQPLLKAVPSELVVLDTKGVETDGSIDVVHSYTDKIYPFRWCNDFSAARNALLEHASGEWFLYLDDDEWFEDVQEIIEFFTSGDYKKYNSAYYQVRNYNAKGTYSTTVVGRMIRRREDTHFVGRIHEGFHKVYGPSKQFSSYAHHVGYVNETPEKAKKKQERNMVLLQEEWKEKGYTPRICAQMTQEYFAYEDTRDKGLEFCMQSIAALYEKKQLQDACSQWLLAASVRYFRMKKNHTELLRQAEWVWQLGLNRVTQLVVAATAVLSAVDVNDLATVGKYADIYLEQWDWYQEHAMEATNLVQLDFPKYLTKEFCGEILNVAAQVAHYCGESEKEAEYLQRMKQCDDCKK